MKILLLSLILLLFLNPPLSAQGMQFTPEDRDRLIRLEVRLEEAVKSLQRQIDDLKAQISDLKKSFQTQIDDVKKSFQAQIDDLKTFLLWGFGILFGGMGILIGFVLWDRRTAIAPVITKSRELEERGERLEKALKEFAKKEPRLEEILKELKIL